VSNEYPAWPKTPRWNKPVTITEKIDGTNGLISIEPVVRTNLADYANPEASLYMNEEGTYRVKAGSRNRWLMPGKTTDNYGFAGWVHENAFALIEKLGPGRHYGEWFGKGIQRGYGLTEKHFALFNVDKWNDVELPDRVTTVPILWRGNAQGLGPAVHHSLSILRHRGSYVAPMEEAEGLCIYHSASRQIYKVLLENDDIPKSVALRMVA
jgi:hypothetical protein